MDAEHEYRILRCITFLHSSQDVPKDRDVADFAVGVEALVVGAGHCLVVVFLRKGYDPAWVLLAELRGEADRPLAPVAVVGGNFHIAIA